MAGKFGSPSVWFLVGGFNLISAKLQALRAKIVSLTEKSDGLGDTYVDNTPVGVSMAEVVQEGAFFDTSSPIHSMHDGEVSALTPQSTPRVVCLGFAGNTIGEPFFGASGVYQDSYEVLAEIEKLQRANVTHKVTGQFDQGVILHELSTETGDDDTEDESVDGASVTQQVIPITSNSQANPTVVTTPVPHGLTTGDTVLIAGVAGSSPDINGEQAVTVITTTTFSVPVNTSGGSGGTGGSFTRGLTQQGGAAYLQMTALALGGFDDAEVAILDSADDITFGELVAFTPRTAIGAERVTVAGSVERYWAQGVVFNGAGSSESVTYFAGLCRF